MIVTKITEVTKAKYSIEIDHEFAFVLYKGELRTYGIREEEEITEGTYHTIMNEVLPKRAKLRCMNLLKSRDYTRYQLGDKLKQGKYPEEIIEAALDYVESYHYIDDRRYIESYIRYAGKMKSRKQIEQDLVRKGCNKELIRIIYDEQDFDNEDERELIQKLMVKKHFERDKATYEETQKFVAFLYRKGFALDEIYRVIGKN